MRPFIALILLLGCAAVAAAGDAKPEAPRIAVLRLEDTLLGFKMYTGGMEKLKKEVAEGQAKIKELEDHLQDLESKLQVIKRDSEQWVKLNEDFELTKLKEKMMVDRGNEDIAHRRAALVKEAYATLRAHLQAFCQERGVKLVHLAPKPELSAQDNKELNQELFAQSVLYFDASLDITDAFIPYLNERWAAEPPKDQAPAAAPAPPKDAAPKDAAPKDAAPKDAPAPAPAPAK
jgi:Skp family chaperone for outer membrane proteins